MSDKFDVDALIEERSNTHGDYMVNSEITWTIKEALHRGAHYDSMHPAMKETLDMVAHKMHRIVNGDPFFKDHWVDMTGYPHLVVGKWDELVAWRNGRIAPHNQLRLSPEEIDTIFALRDGRASVVLNTGLSPAQQQMKVDLTTASGSFRDDVLENGTSASIKWAGDDIVVEVVGHSVRDGVIWYDLLDDAGNPYTRPRSQMTVPPAAGSAGAVLQAVPEPLGAPGEPSEGTTDTTLAAATTETPEASAVPWSHDVRREPILLTNFEYLQMKGQLVRHGSHDGTFWQGLYRQRDDGRWEMDQMYQEQYGK